MQTPENSSSNLGSGLNRVMERLKTRPAPSPTDDLASERRCCLATLEGDLGKRYALSRVRLDRYEVYHPAQRPVMARLAKLIDRIDELVAAGSGIIFYGTVGTGKDHLMAAMLYAAAGGCVSCRWVNGQEVFGQFRDRIDTGQRDEEYFRELAKPSVLAISDPVQPANKLGNWDAGNLYRLLDRRYRAMKPTWVSLNAESVDDADARLSAPVFDRLREGAELIPCFWPSYRERRNP